MIGWYIFFGVAAALLLYPFVRFFCKRCRLYGRLKRACKRSGCRLGGTRTLWMFATRYGKQCDFVIETSTALLSVKLFGTCRRASCLVFTEQGQYYTRHFLALFAHWQNALMSVDFKKHDLPPYDFASACENIAKPRQDILLIHPVCMEIKKGQTPIAVGDGDMVNGMVVMSLSGLLSVIEETNKERQPLG